jgi:hypothetical protein
MFTFVASKAISESKVKVMYFQRVSRAEEIQKQGQLLSKKLRTDVHMQLRNIETPPH